MAARRRRAEDLICARLERAAALQQLAAAERLGLAVTLLLGQQLRGGVGGGIVMFRGTGPYAERSAVECELLAQRQRVHSKKRGDTKARLRLARHSHRN